MILLLRLASASAFSSYAPETKRGDLVPGFRDRKQRVRVGVNKQEKMHPLVRVRVGVTKQEEMRPLVRVRVGVTKQEEMHPLVRVRVG